MMDRQHNRTVIHKLILLREFGRQGYRWNRAFRKELWRRLKEAEPRSREKERPVREKSERDEVERGRRTR